MAAVEIVPRAAVEPVTEQRHCPQCGQIYTCKPLWRPKACPPCNGRRVALMKANPQADIAPTLTPESRPGAQRPLDLELLAMRITANWLEDLDIPARARVLAWLGARYGGES